MEDNQQQSKSNNIELPPSSDYNAGGSSPVTPRSVNVRDRRRLAQINKARFSGGVIPDELGSVSAGGSLSRSRSNSPSRERALSGTPIKRDLFKQILKKAAQRRESSVNADIDNGDFAEVGNSFAGSSLAPDDVELVAEVGTSLVEYCDELKEQLLACEEEKSQLLSQNHELEEKLANTSNLLARTSQSQQSLQNRVWGLELVNQENLEKVASAEEALLRSNQELAELRAEHSKLNDEFERCRLSEQQLIERIGSLMTEREAEGIQTRKTMAELRSENSQLYTLIDEYQLKLLKLKEETKNGNHGKGPGEGENIDGFESNQIASQLLKQINEENERLQSLVHGYELDMKNLKSSISAFEKDRLELNSMLSQSQETIESLKEERDSLAWKLGINTVGSTAPSIPASREPSLPSSGLAKDSSVPSPRFSGEHNLPETSLKEALDSLTGNFEKIPLAGELNSSITEKDLEISNLKGQLEKSEIQIRSIEGELRKSQRDYSDLVQVFDRERKSWDTESAQLKNAIQALELKNVQDQQKFSSELEDLTKSLQAKALQDKTAMELKFSDENVSLKDNFEKILKSSKDEALEQNSLLTTQLDNLKTELASLTISLNNERNTVESLRREVEDINFELDQSKTRLKDTLSEKEIVVSELKEEHDKQFRELTSELEKLKQEFLSKQTEYAALFNDNEEKTILISRLKVEISGANTLLLEKDGKLEALQKALEKSNASILLLSSEKAEKEDLANKTELSLIEVTGKWKDREYECNRLRKELELFLKKEEGLSSDINNLKAQLLDLESCFATAKEEKESLRKLLDEAQQEAQTQSSRIRISNENTKEQIKKQRALEKELEDATKHLSMKDNEIGSLTERLNSLTDEISSCKVALQSKEKLVNELENSQKLIEEARRSDSEAFSAALEEKSLALSKLEKVSEYELKVRNAMIDESKCRAAEAEETIASLKREIASLSNYNDDLKEKSVKSNEEIQKLLSTISSADKEIQELKNSVSLKDESLAKISLENQAQSELLKDFDQKVLDLEDNLRSELQSVNQLQRQVKVLTGSLEESREMLNHYSQTNSHVTEKLLSTERILSEREEHIKVLEVQLAESGEHLSLFAATKSALERKLDSSEAEFSKLLERSKSLEATLSHLEKELSARNSEFKNLEREKSFIIREFESFKASATVSSSGYENEIKKLKDEKDSLLKESNLVMSDLKNQLSLMGSEKDSTLKDIEKIKVEHNQMTVSLESRLQEMAESLKLLESQLSESAIHKSNLEKALCESADNEKALQADLKKSSSIVLSLETNLNALKSKHDKVLLSLEESILCNKDIESRLSLLLVNQEKLVSEISQKDQALTSLKASNDNILASMKSEFDAKEAALRGSNEDLRLQLSQISKEKIELTNSVNQLMEEIATRDSKIAELENKLESEHQKFSSISNEKVDLVNLLSSLKEEISTKASAIQELESKLQSELSQLERVSTEKLELINEIKHLEEEVVSRDSTVVMLESKLETEVQRLATLSSEKVELANQLSLLKEEVTKKASVAQELENKLKSEVQQLANVSTEKLQLVNEISSMKVEVAERDSQIMVLQSKLESEVENLSKVSNEKVDLVTSIGSLKEELVSKESLIVSLKVNHDSEVCQLANEKVKLCEEINRLKEEITAKDSSITKLEGRLESEAEKFSTLSAESSNQIVQLKQELSLKLDSFEDLERKLALNTTSMESLISKLQESENSLTELTNSSAEAIKTLEAELKLKGEEFASERKLLQDQLEEGQNSLKMLEVQYAAASQKIALLENDMSSSSKELGSKLDSLLAEVTEKNMEIESLQDNLNAISSKLDESVNRCEFLERKQLEKDEAHHKEVSKLSELLNLERGSVMSLKSALDSSNNLSHSLSKKIEILEMEKNDLEGKLQVLEKLRVDDDKEAQSRYDSLNEEYNQLKSLEANERREYFELNTQHCRLLDQQNLSSIEHLELVKSLEERLSLADVRRDQLESDLSNANQKSAEKDSEFQQVKSDLSSKISSLDSELKAATNDLLKKDEDLRLATAKASSIEAEILSYSQRLSDLQAELTNTRENYFRLEKDSSHQEALITNRLKAKEELLSSLEEGLKQKIETVSLLEKENSAMKAQVDNALVRIDSTEASLNESIKQHQIEATELKGKISILMTEIQEGKDKIMELTGRLAQRENENSELKASLDAEALKFRFHSEQSKDFVSQMQLKNNELQELLEAANNEITLKDSSLKESLQSLQKVESTNEVLKNKVENLETDLDAMHREKAALKTEHQLSLADLEAKLEAEQRNYKDLKSSSNILVKELELRLEEEKATLQRIVDDLNSKLASLDDEYKMSEASHESYRIAQEELTRSLQLELESTREMLQKSKLGFDQLEAENSKLNSRLLSLSDEVDNSKKQFNESLSQGEKNLFSLTEANSKLSKDLDEAMAENVIMSRKLDDLQYLIAEEKALSASHSDSLKEKKESIFELEREVQKLYESLSREQEKSASLEQSLVDAKEASTRQLESLKVEFEASLSAERKIEDSLRLEIKEYLSELSKERELNTSLASELEKTKAQLSQLEATKVEIKSEIQLLKNAIIEERKKMTEEIELVKKEHLRSTTMKDEIEKELSALNSTILQKEASLKESAQERESELHKFTSSLEALRTDNAALEKEIVQLKELLTAERGKFDAVQNSVSELAQAKESLSQIEVSHVKLVKDYEEAQVQVSVLKNEKEFLESKVSILEKVNRETSPEKLFESERNLLENKLSDLRKSADQVLAERDNLQVQINRLTREVDFQIHEVEHFKGLHLAACERESNLLEQVTLLQTCIQGNEKELEAAKREKLKIEEERDSKIQKLLSKETGYLQEISKLKAELSNIMSEQSAMEKRNYELSEEVSKLQIVTNPDVSIISSHREEETETDGGEKANDKQLYRLDSADLSNVLLETSSDMMGYPSLNDIQRATSSMAMFGESSIVTSLTQMMSGAWMYKYPRRANTKLKESDQLELKKFHKRFFWVNPFTMSIMWAEDDPTSMSKSKSARICDVSTEVKKMPSRLKTSDSFFDIQQKDGLGNKVLSQADITHLLEPDNLDVEVGSSKMAGNNDQDSSLREIVMIIIKTREHGIRGFRPSDELCLIPITVEEQETWIKGLNTLVEHYKKSHSPSVKENSFAKGFFPTRWTIVDTTNAIPPSNNAIP